MINKKGWRHPNLHIGIYGFPTASFCFWREPPLIRTKNSHFWCLCVEIFFSPLCTQAHGNIDCVFGGQSHLSDGRFAPILMILYITPGTAARVTSHGGTLFSFISSCWTIRTDRTTQWFVHSMLDLPEGWRYCQFPPEPQEGGNSFLFSFSHGY